MGANDRNFRLQSDEAINQWDYAELGDKLAKKLHKKDMRRQKRTLEKKELRQRLRYEE